MNSIYYSEIQKIIYDMGHRENFLYSTVDAIDTLILNYLYRYEEIKNGKVTVKDGKLSCTIKKGATVVIY